MHFQLLFELPNSICARQIPPSKIQRADWLPGRKYLTKMPGTEDRGQSISFWQQCVCHTHSEFVWVLGMNRWIRGIHSLAMNHNLIHWCRHLFWQGQMSSVQQCCLLFFFFAVVPASHNLIFNISTKEYCDFLFLQDFQSTKTDFHKKHSNGRHEQIMLWKCSVIWQTLKYESPFES